MAIMNNIRDSRVRGSAVWLLAAGVAAFSPAPWADEHPAHWSYSGATGPEHWASEDAAFATCGTGQRQSPIDIRTTVVKELPAIQFAYKPVPLTVTDTGHSFQVNAPAGSGGITVGGDHYDLVQFHFHRPSEERIRGRSQALVAHLVHKNADGKLAVVAVLIHRGDANVFLKPVFDNFPPKGTPEAPVAGTTVNLSDFLPQKQGYFTFEGSLTTPPCSEQVRWFVLKTPVSASAAQVQQFAARYPNNARPVQPVNDRTVAETRD
jgi:carbonic anhydrase